MAVQNFLSQAPVVVLYSHASLKPAVVKIFFGNALLFHFLEAKTLHYRADSRAEQIMYSNLLASILSSTSLATPFLAFEVSESYWASSSFWPVCNLYGGSDRIKATSRSILSDDKLVFLHQISGTTVVNEAKRSHLYVESAHYCSSSLVGFEDSAVSILPKISSSLMRWITALVSVYRKDFAAFFFFASFALTLYRFIQTQTASDQV